VRLSRSWRSQCGNDIMTPHGTFIPRQKVPCLLIRRSSLACVLPCNRERGDRIRTGTPPWQMVPIYRSPDLSTSMCASSVAVPSAEKSSEPELLLPESIRVRSADTKAPSMLRYGKSKTTPENRQPFGCQLIQLVANVPAVALQFRSTCDQLREHTHSRTGYCCRIV
jgi:hypothetical protein